MRFAEKLIRDRWASKGQKVVESNLKALDVGIRYAAQQDIHPAHLQLPRLSDGHDRVILTGYQALCLGAVAAGLKYFGGYPITPRHADHGVAGAIPARLRQAASCRWRMRSPPWGSVLGRQLRRRQGHDLH